MSLHPCLSFYLLDSLPLTHMHYIVKLIHRPSHPEA